MDFNTREDQSATEYALQTNPAFWVRVAKPVGYQLDITSALQGDLTDDEFGAALSVILTRHISDTISAVRISDIASSLTADMTSHDLVCRRFDLLCAVVRSWAEHHGRRVFDSRLDIRNGRQAAVVQLERAA